MNLEEAIDQYRGFVVYLAIRFCHSKQAKKDIIDDAPLLIWKAWSIYSPAKGNLKSLIARVVHNRICNEIRFACTGGKKKGKFRKDIPPDKVILFAPESEEDPWEAITPRLSPTQRQLLDLYIQTNLNAFKTARLMGKGYQKTRKELEDLFRYIQGLDNG